MSFPQLENELKAVKEEIREINNSIKQLIMQMQLINLTFEGMLKPKQNREYTSIEIKLPDKVNPNSDDAKYIERYQNNILKNKKKLFKKLLRNDDY